MTTSPREVVAEGDLHHLFEPWVGPSDVDRPISLAPLLARARDTRGAHPALVGPNGRLDYRSLDALTDRAASALRRLGVRPGDRVAACLPNDLPLVVALMGVWKLGAVFVGVHRALARQEKEFFIDDSGARLLLCDPPTTEEIGARISGRYTMERMITVDPAGSDDEWSALLDRADSEPRVGAVDPLAPAAIAYTSGTTGRPKGVVHSQHNALLPGVVSVVRGSFGPDEPIAVVHPLTILNLMILNPLTTLAAGSTCVLCDRHDAASIARAVKEEGVVCISAVPTVFYELLADPAIDAHDLKTLTKPRTGGAAMSEELKELFTRRFGVRPVTSYASTEAPTLVTRQDETDDDKTPGDLGRPLPHLEVSIRDELGHVLGLGETGEICFGPTAEGPWAGVYRTMLGYWQLPEETAATLRDGVVHSGDVGRLTPDGRLVMVDRKSQLIIRGGSNIYPAEVERVLMADPGVIDCCVVGRSDERLGEVVVAVVEAAKDGPPDLDRLRALCGESLATFKQPAEIIVVDALPRTPLGKVARSVVRKLVE